MTLIQISKWIGGLGNNLEQLVNAYWLAKQTNGQFVCNVDHHLLTVPQSIKFGHDIQQRLYMGFANIDLYDQKIDVNNERFKQYHEILQELSPMLFDKIHKKNFDGLVVHVRAGNIYRKPLCGKYLIQAPIKYFAKAIRALKIKKDILVITSTKHKRDVKRYPNPMTAEIEKYCKGIGITCSVHDGTAVEAAGYLLGATHAMLTGYTTFSRMLLLANSNLETIIIPVMDYWPHDEISFKLHSCKTHYFHIEDYLKTWSCELVNTQINHPLNKIKYRDSL